MDLHSRQVQYQSRGGKMGRQRLSTREKDFG